MKKLLTAKFIIISLSFFFYALGNTLFDLIPLHLETLSSGKREIGFIMSFSGLGGFAVLPILSLIIDRVSLKSLLSRALAVLMLSQSFFLTRAEPYPLYAIPLFIRGALLSLFMIGFITLISQIIPDGKRMMGLSVFGIMGQLPFPLSIGIGESIYHLFGFKTITLIALACFAFSFIILRFFKEGASARTIRSQNRLKNMLLIFRTAGIYPFLFSFFLVGYAFGTFQVYLPGFLFARDISRISLFWIIFPVTIIILRLMCAGVLDRFSQTRLLILPLLFLPLCFLILLGIDSYGQLIFPAVIYGIAHGIMFPVLNAALIGQAPGGYKGRMMVISQLTISLGMFLSARAGGLIAETLSIDAVFRVAAALCFSGILLFAVLGIKKRKMPD